MKKFYIAIQQCRDDKYYAFVQVIPEYQNAYAILSEIPDIVCANIFQTRKAARETVDAWNTTFKYTGVAMYPDSY